MVVTISLVAAVLSGSSSKCILQICSGSRDISRTVEAIVWLIVSFMIFMKIEILFIFQDSEQGWVLVIP